MSPSSISSSPAHPVPPCTCHILPLCEFYSIALPQGHLCASSSSSRLLVYLFFLAGPDPLHEITVPAFSQSTRPYKCVFIPISSVALSVPPPSPYFSRASLPLLSVLSFSCVLCPRNFSMGGGISSCFPPTISFHTF